jgi:hypothetical protein
MNKSQRRSDAAAEGSMLADDLDYVPVPQNIGQRIEAKWADIRMPDVSLRGSARMLCHADPGSGISRHQTL